MPINQSIQLIGKGWELIKNWKKKVGKILHVKDTDRSNRAVSEIDFEVKNFVIFGDFRLLNPSSTG